MNQEKTGTLIRALRLRLGLTQLQLAESIGVSDKAVSKWERGAGAPDIAILPRLAEALETDAQTLLEGEIPMEKLVNGNVQRMRFFVCPLCGNVLAALDGAEISCCGKRLTALKAAESDEAHELHVEVSDGDWYVTTAHEMEREHYLSFIALVSDDTLIMKKLYPQWLAEVRFPRYKYGSLVWYCTEHGLFTKKLY